ncbi:MAG: DUF192 domain-containing protein [Proteobacteria bacterium]|nr:DUF192 domain-containing protein [Pseudomonadota bacterium]
MRGLSGRVAIPADCGMLFVLPYKTSTGFWMKAMLTPLGRAGPAAPGLFCPTAYSYAATCGGIG